MICHSYLKLENDGEGEFKQIAFKAGSLVGLLCAKIDSKHGTGLKGGKRMASYVIKRKCCRFIRLKCNLLIAKNVHPSGPLGNST